MASLTVRIDKRRKLIKIGLTEMNLDEIASLRFNLNKAVSNLRRGASRGARGSYKAREVNGH